MILYIYIYVYICTYIYTYMQFSKMGSWLPNINNLLFSMNHYKAFYYPFHLIWRVTLANNFRNFFLMFHYSTCLMLKIILLYLTLFVNLTYQLYDVKCVWNWDKINNFNNPLYLVKLALKYLRGIINIAIFPRTVYIYIFTY